MPDNPYESPSPAPSTARPAERTGRGGSKFRVVSCLAGTVLAPFVTLSIYLYISRITSTDSGLGDYLALLGSCLFGLVLLWRTPIRFAIRVGLAAAYVPLMGVSLFTYTFVFVGEVFGLWL